MSALHAEWYKLWRRGTVLGVIGTMVGITCLLTAVIFTRASGAAPGASAGQLLSGLSPSLATLSTSIGLVQGFKTAGNFIELIALVFFAQVIGGEYREGTLKVSLSHEPRRLYLLAGKLLALAAFVAVAVLAAFAFQVVTAVVLAGARGASTSAWWTNGTLRNATGLVARTIAAVIVRGLMGGFLAVLFRAAVPAIAVGLGYTFVADALIVAAWPDGRKWLPHEALVAFAQGGKAGLATGQAGVLIAAYAVVFVVVAGVLFRSRDVTT
jgi:ABC-type transport system involved in multi-copper enzyme maturation permease subunit